MIIVLMGVSGAGKSIVGRLLADTLGWSFYEGEDLHTRSNVDKIAQGISLTDHDRWPWLRRIRLLIDDLVSRGQNGVVACSALKQAYRDELVGTKYDVQLFYLKGMYGAIMSRLKDRRDHFMKSDSLESQFQDLEEPDGGVTVNVSSDPQAIVASIKQALGL